MKKISVVLLVIFGIGLTINAQTTQTVSEFFMKIPIDVLPASPENRAKMITETKGDLLKFRISEAKRGEVKVFAQKNGETLIGMWVADCNSSDLKFWRFKNSKSKLVTNSVIESITAKDIPAILSVTPTTVTSLNQTLGIAYFYNFHSDSTNIELFARKPDSCEVAGKFYDYKFDGKKFIVQK